LYIQPVADYEDPFIRLIMPIINDLHQAAYKA